MINFHNHRVTENYLIGMRAISDNRLPEALKALSLEPAGSHCYGLALANKALTELRMENYKASEATGRLALSEFNTNGCPHPPTWVQAFRVLGESISLQDRLDESLSTFNDGCHMADRLADDFPEFADDLSLAQAYTFNSWGGTLLKGHDPDAAIDLFTAARDIYRAFPENEVGCAETLTNLAQAYTEIKKQTEASLAIDEARMLSKNNKEQLHRVNIAAARLGLISKEDARRLLFEAASDAERNGQFETAYMRHCGAAFLAGDANDPVWGMEAVRLAEALEEKLSPESLHPAKLSFFKATFLQDLGRPPAEVLDVLLAGARVWCDRLPGPLGLNDYKDAAGLMHDHFRKLSALLHQEGRNAEAFVAFEIGRARGFAIEVNNGNRHPFLEANPFQGNIVDQSLMTRIQGHLRNDEVLVSIAILPPELVAFIVGSDGLQVSAVDLVEHMADANAFGQAIRAIPANLENDRGLGCFPPQVLAVAKKISEVIGPQRIVLLAPHAMLHKVPWRSLLRSNGVSWAQLPFITQFSPLLDPDRPNPDMVFRTGTVALGHGTAGTGVNALNLEDEAKGFAAASGPGGEFVAGARSADVISALHSDKTVLLSCHGRIVSTEQGDRFLFDLADGGHAPDEMIQNAVISPFVILSACSSGVYEMAWGDYPVGAAPAFLLAGARFCICTRFPIDAHFAKALFPTLARLLNSGQSLGNAFANSLQAMEQQRMDLWKHLACVELLGRGITESKARS